MPIEILMPALSPTMTEGNLVKWCKKEGDSLKSGDVIAEIETDKATMEVESIDEGVLGRILIPAGTQGVKVNALLGVLLKKGEAPDSLKDFKPSSTPSPSTGPSSGPATPPAPESKMNKEPFAGDISGGSPERVFISPLARRIAQQNNVDVKGLTGSGPHGRIIKKDVEASLSQGPAAQRQSSAPRSAGGYVDIPLSTMRRVVARRLTESKDTIPHFYVSMDVWLDPLLEARQDLNQSLPDAQKISVNDFVIKAAAKALIDVPEVNASWQQDFIRQFEDADISVAVAIEGGLITPIIKAAQTKSLCTLSEEMKDLAKRAKEGKLAPHEFQGGNFSISNMGMYGVNAFSAIINPPQAAILAVGGGIQQPIVRNNALQIGTMMTLTLSSDHRVVDGATAALFLKKLKGLLESPVFMLAS